MRRLICLIALLVIPCSVASADDGCVHIATRDSHPLDKANADYLGDGIADQVEIQQAFDELPPGPATICFAKGKYSIDQQVGQAYALRLAHSDVTLCFDLGAALLLSNGQIQEDEQFHVFRIVASNISIEGAGSLDGNRANNIGFGFGATSSNRGLDVVQTSPSTFEMSGGFTIRNVIGTGLNIRGILGDESVRVTDLSVVDCGEGFQIFRATSVRVSNLLVDGMDRQDGFETLGVSDLVLRDSTIRNTRDSAIDIVNIHSFGGQNIRHTYTNLTLGPLIPSNLLKVGVFEVGSKQAFFTNDYITIQASSIDMGNADFGIVFGDFDGTATHQSLNLTASGVTIDGTNSQPGAAGIGVSCKAQFTTLAANLISNCPVAVNRTLNPSDLTIRNNDGTGNAVGISCGSGSNNVLIDNFLD